eukprot:g70341.t1
MSKEEAPSKPEKDDKPNKGEDDAKHLNLPVGSLDDYEPASADASPVKALQDPEREGLPLTRQSKKKATVKVGMLGDSGIGKTSLMVKYVEGDFNEDYIQTLGVNFMQKTIELQKVEINFSIWDLGGQQEYLHMLPLVCNDAAALLFMFDLKRSSTLTSIKTWYKQARLLNKKAIPVLVGTKYDMVAGDSKEELKRLTTLARKFAKAMKASLIFCSASHGVNVQKLFKVVLAKVFAIKCQVPEITTTGHPIIDTARYDLGLQLFSSQAILVFWEEYVTAR